MEHPAILLIGIIFATLGIYAVASYTRKLKRFRIDGYEVTATIVKISGMRKNHRALISYIADSKEQTVELGYYSNSMRIGDKVRLCVSNNDPLGFIYIGKGPVAMGVLFIIIGMALLIMCLLNKLHF